METIEKIQKLTGCTRRIAESVERTVDRAVLRRAGCLSYEYHGEKRNTRELKRAVSDVIRVERASETKRIEQADGLAGVIARAVLAHHPKCNPVCPGWATVDHIRHAAVEAGLECANRLAQWFRPDDTLLEQVSGLIARYVQAYGPVDGLIDLRGHLDGGPGSPIVVRV